MSKPGTPVICLETEERFESMKEAMERYGVSSGSLNSALTYGYSAGGYHFYRADEPKPDAYSRSRAIWHPGATRSVPQDLLLEHPQ